MNYLVVVAHPDDEVLGAGATINKFIKSGHRVAVAIMVGKADARKNLSATLADDEAKAMSIMGVEKVFHADFPNIKMNTVPHLELVQFIESCITDWQAGAIITHHPSDTNIDHQETSKAVNAACRLFQRTDDVPKLKEMLYMEVPSSTEWSLNTAENQFMPNTFVEIGEEGVKVKLVALAAYKGVMRQFPHPRSEKAIEGLAAYRGVQSGCCYAEAFECVLRTE
ncbi:MAG: PIG-L family deacetylase [Dorea sp.]|jgi:LmbE family N-acetylglucosaminyl deacetylase|nr:PIG-L family deacetylase [Dorea sp.]MCI9453986.1 PIG-L family deacetylase [Dorea sp.]